MKKHWIGAAIIIAMTSAQTGCEYYDAKAPAVIKSSEEESEVIKNIEIAIKELQTKSTAPGVSDEEITALKEMIAELEKALADAKNSSPDTADTTAPAVTDESPTEPSVAGPIQNSEIVAGRQERAQAEPPPLPTRVGLAPGAWKSVAAGYTSGEACVASCDSTGWTTNGVITDLIVNSDTNPGSPALVGVQFGCAKISSDPKTSGTAWEDIDPKRTEGCGMNSATLGGHSRMGGAPYVAIGLSGIEENGGFRCLRLIQAPLLTADAAAGGDQVDYVHRKYSSCLSTGTDGTEQVYFPDLLCQPGEVMTGAKFSLRSSPSYLGTMNKNVRGITEIQCKKVELKYGIFQR